MGCLVLAHHGTQVAADSYEQVAPWQALDSNTAAGPFPCLFRRLFADGLFTLPTGVLQEALLAGEG